MQALAQAAIEGTGELLVRGARMPADLSVAHSPGALCPHDPEAPAAGTAGGGAAAAGGEAAAAAGLWAGSVEEFLALAAGAGAGAGVTRRLWDSAGVPSGEGAGAGAEEAVAASAAGPGERVPSRSRSRSPPGGGGEQRVLEFGRHRGSTYLQVLLCEPGYCQWALRMEHPSGPLRHFQDWLRRRLALGPAAAGAGGRAAPATPPEALAEGWAGPPRSPLGRQAQHEDEEGGGDAAPRPGVPPGHGWSQTEMRAGATTAWGEDLREFLLRLPRVPFCPEHFSGSPYPDSCPICMESWEEADPQAEIALTPCLHVFHAHCLGGWLARHRECPSCRWDVADVGEARALQSSGARPCPPRPAILEPIEVSDDEET